MVDTMTGDENRDRARLALTTLTVLEGIGAVPLCCLAPFSIFGFDKPGSEKDPAVWGMVLGMVGLPVLVIGLLRVGWLLFGRRRAALAFVAVGFAGLIELVVFGFFALTILLVPKAGP